MSTILRYGFVMLKRSPGERHNSYGGTNLGSIKVENHQGEELRLRFSLCGHRGKRPVWVYRSGRL